MVRCYSKERETLEGGEKGDVCNNESIKVCSHEFHSCKKHHHGCQTDEIYKQDN